LSFKDPSKSFYKNNPDSTKIILEESENIFSKSIF
jgi:hypothetical protein